MTYSSFSCDELVRACVDAANAEAWEEFVRRFEKLIGIVIWRVARRHGQNDGTIVKDLVQETYAKVCGDRCRLLREFRPHHEDAFIGMLRVTAANVARDYFRARKSTKRGSGQPESTLDEAEAVVPTVSAGPDHMERSVLLEEIDSLLTSIGCGEREREIFWLYHRQGVTAKDIARNSSYGLTAKGIESLLHRLRSQLRTKLVEQQPPYPKGRGAEGIQEERTLSKGEGPQ